MSSGGFGVWGTAGYGTGSTEVEDRDGSVETDVAMHTVAAGVRNDVASIGEVDLAVKADALYAMVSADGVEGELLSVDAEASRLRLAIEGSARRSLAGGGELAGHLRARRRVLTTGTPNGARAPTLRWASTTPFRGPVLEVRGRGSVLLAHEQSGFREWGLGLGLGWDPGVRGRGLQFLLAPSWRTPASDVADAMWNAEPGATRGRADDGASFDARLGYGWGVLRERAVTTAFGELGRSGNGERFRLGVALRLREPAGAGLEFYGERRGDRSRPEDLIMLKGGIVF